MSRLATKRLSIGKQRWIVKFWSGHHGVGHMMKHRGKQESSRCPVCGASNEKTSHLLQCFNPEAIKLVQTKYKEELEPVLTKHKTDPSLLKVFKKILQLHSVKSQLTMVKVGIGNVGVTFTPIQQAFREQAKIGWNNFVLGRWSKKWQLIQQAHYKRCSLSNTSRQWAVAIIAKLHDIAWDRWNFCNGIAHGGDGLVQRLHHRRLNRIITSEFGEGPYGLPSDSRWLLTNKPLSEIKDYNLVTKTNWIKSVNAARKAYANAGQRFKYFRPFRQGLRRWLVRRQ